MGKGGGISAVIFFQRLVLRERGETPNEDLINQAVPEARTCVHEIARLMADGPFLVDNDLTIADLLLFPQLEYFSMTPEGERLLSERPTVSAWLDRMRSRTSVSTVLAA